MPPRAWPLMVILSFCANSARAITSHRIEDELAQIDRAQAQSLRSAIELARQKTTLKGDRSVFWFTLGNLLLEDNQPADARKAYTQVVQNKGPLSPAAQLSIAKTYATEKQMELELRVLAQINLNQASPTLRSAVQSEFARARLILATELYQAQDFIRAEAELKNIPALLQNDEWRFLQSYLWLHQKKSREARELLKVLSQNATRSEDRQSAARLLDDLNRAEQAPLTPWGARIDVGAGINTNVYSVAFDSAGQATPSAAKAVALGIVDLQKRVATSPQGWGLRLSNHDQWEEIVGQADERYFLIQLRAEPEKIWRDQNAEWSASLGPGLRYEALGSVSYSLRPGGRMQFAHANNFHIFALELEYTHNLAPDAQYKYLAGSSFLSSLSYTRLWTHWSLSGVTGYTRESSSDFIAPGARLPISHRSFNVGAALKYTPNSQWVFTVNPSWSWKFFDSISIPGNIERTDLLIQLGLRAERTISGPWGLFLTANETVNQSTLGPRTVSNRNYHQTKVIFGLSWDLGT